MLYLNEEFSKTWQGRDPFEVVSSLEGTIYRDVKNRQTLKFCQDGKNYFLKRHTGVGWLEIIKNLFQLRLPVISAENEWVAVTRLRELGLDTMTLVAYGKKGSNPAAIQSFIITAEITNSVSLEELCATWPSSRPAFLFKQCVITKVARIAGEMHRNGICHRDFYICHFLLHKSKDGKFIPQNPRLSLIDLHRALSQTKLGKRWIEKDIAGLYFSAMDIGLTRRDLYRFMCAYQKKGLRETLQQDSQFWNQVEQKARALYRKHHQREPVL